MYMMMMNSNIPPTEITPNNHQRQPIADSTIRKNTEVMKRKSKNSDKTHTNSKSPTTCKKQKTNVELLYDQSWCSNKKSKPYVVPEKSHQEIQVMKGLNEFRWYTREVLAEEMSWGVSTKLELKTNPWDMHKVLTESDCNNLCRLLVGKQLVQQHILHLWSQDPNMADKFSKINEKTGALVRIYDMDRGEEYEMTLKRLVSSECYVFGLNWMSMFVRERKLKKGDEIGMFWSRFQSRFIFSLLARAPPPPPPPPVVA